VEVSVNEGKNHKSVIHKFVVGLWLCGWHFYFDCNK